MLKKVNPMNKQINHKKIYNAEKRKQIFKTDMNTNNNNEINNYSKQTNQS